MKSIALISLFLLATALSARPLRANRGPQQPQKPSASGQGVPLREEPHHHMLYENADMRILDLDLGPHQSTLLEQHSFDYLFIALQNSQITVQRLGQSPMQVELPQGAVRYDSAGFSDTLTNDGNHAFRAVTIEFLNPHLTAGGCSCTGGPADAICSCPNASPLPANWQRRIGRVRLAGVTLQPGATYDIDSQMTTRFLVAVTPFDVINNSIHEPKHFETRLPPGYFHWLAPGNNSVQNITSQPQRFVKVEFWGTPVNPPVGKAQF